MELREQRNMAILLITHNMGIVAEMCDRVAVMHSGKIVELSSMTELFKNPAHPYTSELLRSIPTLSSPPKTPLATVTWEPTAEQRTRSDLVEIAPQHYVSAWVA
jgi:ABC-type dipeptide/oligopeptide/nickel transport system ATPase component